MDGGRVRGNQYIELAKSIGDGTAVKTGNELARDEIDIFDIADVAVVDLFVIVIFDLHNLVARGECPAEPFDLAITCGIERRACNSMFNDRAPTPPRFIGHNTWMSRMGSRPNRLGIRVFTSSMMRGDGGFGLVRLHEIKVTFRFRWAEIRDVALVDTMRSGDDAALCGLPEHFGEPYYRYGTRRNDVGKNLAWPHRRKLVDVPHDQ